METVSSKERVWPGRYRKTSNLILHVKFGLILCLNFMIVVKWNGYFLICCLTGYIMEGCSEQDCVSLKHDYWRVWWCAWAVDWAWSADGKVSGRASATYWVKLLCDMCTASLTTHLLIIHSLQTTHWYTTSTIYIHRISRPSQQTYSQMDH